MRYPIHYADVSTLVGLTLSSITGLEAGSGTVVFETTCGRKFQLWHQQDCCEEVSIEDIVGDPEDLVGSPLLLSEEVSGYVGPDRSDSEESYTWTFYKFGTIRGYVDVRWFGASNGYYGESADFTETTA